MAPDLSTLLPTDSRCIDVNTPSRRYRAVVGVNLLERVPALASAALAVPQLSRAALLFDGGVPEDTVQRLGTAFRDAGVALALRGFQPSEESKSLASVGEMLEALTAHALERAQPVVALGGGIVGDMAGFAAASYRRGVPWINCPTTLLSMVDASVGGKTGVNIAAGGTLKKNMAGAFWQPSLVVADVGVLSSLPERHFRAGLAECIKHGLLAGAFGDATLGAWTMAHLPRIVAREHAALTELVARNIAVKARVVELDEREEAPDAAGGRALLNLGHTFAHAIETIPTLSPTGRPQDAPLQHGEAVALGLAAACQLSVSLGVLGADVRAATIAALEAAGLPTQVRGLPTSKDILSRMLHDKKVASGRLRLIIAATGATARVISDAPEAAVLAAIDSIRART